VNAIAVALERMLYHQQVLADYVQPVISPLIMDIVKHVPLVLFLLAQALRFATDALVATPPAQHFPIHNVQLVVQIHIHRPLPGVHVKHALQIP
jgi:hypothetical protein